MDLEDSFISLKVTDRRFFHLASVKFMFSKMPNPSYNCIQCTFSNVVNPSTAEQKVMRPSMSSRFLARGHNNR